MNARCVLETEEITVGVSPDEGGRICSLRSKASGLEFLTQSTRNSPVGTPGMERLFHEGPCAGIEECVPSVAPCGPETIGGAVPDHGDFWQLPWRTIEPATPGRISIEAVGFSRPLRFRKDLEVSGSRLRIRYLLENVGGRQVSFLYAHHPLLAVAADDRIILPIAARRLTVNYSLGDRLGRAGATVDWPHGVPGDDLSRAGDLSAGTAEMLYTQRLAHGQCGIWRASQQQGVKLCWDVSKLPFLGVWLCYGGWPNIAGYEQQYAVALEPTLAPCGTLGEAVLGGHAMKLQRGECFDWTIEYTVGRAGISYDKYASGLES